ncbi:MAG: 4-(cytidine 5'-diphospho)-2-C-methyl-D-erythritol kinase [Fusobacteria bacterium]|nr:4-(cytidine 5'-diphospho)-2-C-methyl-D-erythritol kinase [Fusobacteriota bacterium]
MDIIKCNAKINIGLNVIGKRNDGYHELRMIMAPIDFSDTLHIQYQKGVIGEFNMSCNIPFIPTDKRNILYKIYDSFYFKTGIIPEKINISLMKKVPIQAGLGGGSSNGAFLLKYLNVKHNNILSLEEMIKISKKIGADIPFFLINKTALVEGIGEKIDIVKNTLNCDIILIKPTFGVSTKEAFENISKIILKKDVRIDNIRYALENNDIEGVKANIFNDIERSLLLTNQKIIDIKYLENKLKNINLFMSGSGSTYFVLVNKNSSEKVYNELKNIFPIHSFFLYKTHFINN